MKYSYFITYSPLSLKLFFFLLLLLHVGCSSNDEGERSVYFFYSPTPSPYLVFKGRWEFSGFPWLWEAVSVFEFRY